MKITKVSNTKLEIECGMIEFMPDKTVTQAISDFILNQPQWKPYIERVKPLYQEKYNIFTMLVKDFPAIKDNAGYYLIPLELEIINPKIIVVNGRSWFCKSVGSSYFSVSIELDGKPVEGIECGRGYGNDYVWSAFRKLSQDGLITPIGQNEAPWTYCEKNGIIFSYQITQVARKKDL